jgi:hypothetical protein
VTLEQAARAATGWNLRVADDLRILPPATADPLGASGARLLGGRAHELRRRRGGRALAAICIGVGQGLTVVLEA